MPLRDGEKGAQCIFYLLIYHTRTHIHTHTHTHTLQPGFQIDSELLNGRNALHYAADYGQAEVIEYLVKKGAKLDVSVCERERGERERE